MSKYFKWEMRRLLAEEEQRLENKMDNYYNNTKSDLRKLKTIFLRNNLDVYKGVDKEDVYSIMEILESEDFKMDYDIVIMKTMIHAKLTKLKVDCYGGFCTDEMDAFIDRYKSLEQLGKNHLEYGTSKEDVLMKMKALNDDLDEFRNYHFVQLPVTKEDLNKKFGYEENKEEVKMGEENKLMVMVYEILSDKLAMDEKIVKVYDEIVASFDNPLLLRSYKDFIGDELDTLKQANEICGFCNMSIFDHLKTLVFRIDGIKSKDLGTLQQWIFNHIEDTISMVNEFYTERELIDDSVIDDIKEKMKTDKTNKEQLVDMLNVIICYVGKKNTDDGSISHNIDTLLKSEVFERVRLYPEDGELYTPGYSVDLILSKLVYSVGILYEKRNFREVKDNIKLLEQAIVEQQSYEFHGEFNEVFKAIDNSLLNDKHREELNDIRDEFIMYDQFANGYNIKTQIDLLDRLEEIKRGAIKEKVVVNSTGELSKEELQYTIDDSEAVAKCAENANSMTDISSAGGIEVDEIFIETIVHKKDGTVQKFCDVVPYIMKDEWCTSDAIKNSSVSRLLSDAVNTCKRVITVSTPKDHRKLMDFIIDINNNIEKVSLTAEDVDSIYTSLYDIERAIDFLRKKTLCADIYEMNIIYGDVIKILKLIMKDEVELADLEKEYLIEIPPTARG